MFARSLWLGLAVQIAAVVAVTAPGVKAHSKRAVEEAIADAAQQAPAQPLFAGLMGRPEPRQVASAMRPLDLDKLSMTDFGDVDNR